MAELTADKRQHLMPFGTTTQPAQQPAHAKGSPAAAAGNNHTTHTHTRLTHTCAYTRTHTHTHTYPYTHTGTKLPGNLTTENASDATLPLDCGLDESSFQPTL